jgi:hypothetical protein
MPVIALLTWIAAALGGLYLLAVWLIEYDREFHSAAATRLPVPVVAAHVLLAVAGLFIWAAYLFTDVGRLAELAAAIVAVVAGLGATLARRWFTVYRSVPAGSGGGGGQAAVPPERNFPLPVVIGHGVLAFTTLILVLLTAAGIGSS